MTELREPVPPPPPPAPVPAGWEGILEPGETLSWSAQKSMAVMLVPLIWAIVGASILAALMVDMAPRTWSVAAYCAKFHSSRCGSAFFVMWPGVILFGGGALYMNFRLPSVARGHAQLCYAITSSRALRLELGKPKSLAKIHLKGARAQRNFLGNFQVKRSRFEHVTFHGLAESEFAEAMTAAMNGGVEKWP